jgi:branched-subunit amino acid aminotransferase/4-amino-4-deoxychorismate lyase
MPRELAKISPFDSSVQGGDATWEGIRIYNGRVFHLNHHLNRLFRSAKALGFENVHSREEITDAIFRVLASNGMRDGAHLRLTLTRGEKCTSSMNPYFNVYGTTLIILPEWKPTEGATTYDNEKGISLITAGACRRSPPSTLDNKIHHNNMIQNILPKIQANLAGAADSVMLDTEGFVSETNATNLFMVRCDSNCHAQNGLGGSTGEDDGCSEVLITPTADHCLPGITRGTVLILAKELGIKCEVRRVSLSEFYAADEVFTTGTMGELTPVTKIDGRVIGSGKRGILTERLQKAYKRSIETRLEWSTEIPPFC